MKTKIEELPESRIAYFRNIGEYGEKQNKQLMESFKKWLHSNGEFDHSSILGIPQDNPAITPKEECRYDVCVMIDENSAVSAPAQVGYLSGGKYAVFLLDHTKEAVSGFWENIFSEMEKNHLSVRQQPIIERYSQQMIDNHLCEILVPIQ
ncbi:DNA gyrase inhibitor GyrI [Terribacillus halophilus]|uniref:DNA gyrase inhibitor GyrI n=1 Tax=Terribacillus halophilus TaxID=361279 RepID=A0A1G6MSG3_9BACI|nr:GyrI-like domain-containing protein [Terribacillus halophilus]SDC58489.1 DNA gyrase inhibitor GyrI [Terribacillus halophilus]